jgi:hypothetical protein
MRTERKDPVEVSTVSPPINTHYRGRKMKPGKYIAGPARVFLCYCDVCNSKIIVPTSYLQNFNRYYKSESKSLRVRLLKYLISRINTEDN